MGENEPETLRFMCTCGREIEIDSSIVLDDNNPEISLISEGWYVLYTDWAIESGCVTFYSLDCLASWVENTKAFEKRLQPDSGS